MPFENMFLILIFIQMPYKNMFFYSNTHSKALQEYALHLQTSKNSTGQVFFFNSVHSASFIKFAPLLRRRGGLHILSWEKSSYTVISHEKKEDKNVTHMVNWLCCNLDTYDILVPYKFTLMIDERETVAYYIISRTTWANGNIISYLNLMRDK